MSKVVFVNRFCHPDLSATSQILSDLAAGLAAQGMAVFIIASRQLYNDPSRDLPSSEIWQGVQIHRVWTTTFGRTRLLGRAIDYLTFYLSLPWVLWRMLRRGDIVVAKTDPPLVALVVAPVARLRRAIQVNWLQDVFPEVAIELGQPPVPRLLAWILKGLRDWSMKAGAMNVTIGERMAQYFVSRGIDARHVVVIPNWAHEHSIQPVSTGESRLRSRLGWQDRFVVGYCGNLGRAHDWKTMFSAAKHLVDHDRITFLIVGGGHGYERFKAKSLKAGLSNVQFLPPVSQEQLSDTLAAADLQLLSLRPALEGKIVPSKFYGIAAAQRAAGFIGDTDGEVARLVDVNRCGFAVEEGRADVLCEAILRLAVDGKECRAQGLRGRMMLDAQFSRDSAHRKWAELLNVLGGYDTLNPHKGVTR